MPFNFVLIIEVLQILSSSLKAVTLVTNGFTNPNLHTGLIWGQQQINNSLLLSCSKQHSD